MITRIFGMILFSAATAMAAESVNILPRPQTVEPMAGTDVRVADGLGNVRYEIVTDSALGDEGYRLESGGGSVLIRANSPAGLFYGRQTLQQIIDGNRMAPAVRITDRPRFA